MARYGPREIGIFLRTAHGWRPNEDGDLESELVDGRVLLRFHKSSDGRSNTYKVFAQDGSGVSWGVLTDRDDTALPGIYDTISKSYVE